MWAYMGGMCVGGGDVPALIGGHACKMCVRVCMCAYCPYVVVAVLGAVWWQRGAKREAAVVRGHIPGVRSPPPPPPLDDDTLLLLP